MTNYACPECYEPIPLVKRGHDGRCKVCRNVLERDARSHGVRRTKTTKGK